MSSFKIVYPKQNFNRTTQIKSTLQTQQSGIYIHRYENPLLSQRKKKVYNLPINQVNKIEIIFSNSLSIELEVDKIGLIGEVTKAASGTNSKIRLNLFTDISKMSCLVKIPALCNEYKAELGFFYNSLDEFKLIGYELTTLTFKMTHEIMFAEISSPKSSVDTTITTSTSRLDSFVSCSTLEPLQPSYDLKMIPKLPIIHSVEIYSTDDNQNKQCVSQLINSKLIAIASKLGICETHELEIKLEENSNDLKILEFRLIVQNDQQAQKLGVNIYILSHESSLVHYDLRIDSSNFSSNNLLDENELNISTYLEIKYTNAMGLAQNQCNIFKIQLMIRFTQTVYFSLKDLIDLDEKTFEMTLEIKNLSRASIILKQEEEKDKLVDENQSIELKMTMKKLELIDDDASFNMIESINEKLKQLRYSTAAAFSSSPFSALKFNTQAQQQFVGYNVRMRRCPIQLYIKRTAIDSCEDRTGPRLYSLMLIAKNSLGHNNLSNDCYFYVTWKNANLNYSIVSKNRNWILRDLNSKFWAYQIKVLVNDKQYKCENYTKFSITLKKDNKELIYWNYSYNLYSNELSYILN